jgi:rhodanese-related sulfurtransferase
MDTVIRSIPAADLSARLGSPAWPVVLDVRRPPAYDRDTETLPAARRCPPDEVEALAASLPPGAEVVTYCVHGHEVSQGAAQALAARGFDSRYLEGGIEHWRGAGLPRLRKHAAFGIPGAHASRWLTRERPKIDRIACPWLVRRFVDARAEFGYVPSARSRTTSPAGRSSTTASSAASTSCCGSSA